MKTGLDSEELSGSKKSHCRPILRGLVVSQVGEENMHFHIRCCKMTSQQLHGERHTRVDPGRPCIMALPVVEKIWKQPQMFMNKDKLLNNAYNLILLIF